MTKQSWRKGSLALAVSAALTLGVAPAYAAGDTGIVGSINVTGSASDYTVVIKNNATGFTREIRLEDVEFRFTQLPLGEYEVSVSKAGTIVAREKVRVSLGSNAVANFDLNTVGAETIEVVGARPSAVDVTTMDSGLVIGETEFDRMPVGRNLTAVALLAPGTIRAEGDFGNTASFGGSSAAENVCYINGLEVTNTRTGLGCSAVPFEFFKEFQVKTGGYTTQFGRATGGMINAVTKSGTNEWNFQFRASTSPDGLAERGPVSRSTAGTGSLQEVAFANFTKDYTDFSEFSIAGGGPLIQDKLFIYAIINPRYSERGFESNTNPSGSDDFLPSNQYDKGESKGADNTFWGAKVDWDMADGHRLSLFTYSDRNDETRQIYDWTPQTGTIGNNTGDLVAERGSEAYSLNYVGQLTNDLTINVLLGNIESTFFNAPTNTVCPSVADGRDNPNPEIHGCGSGLSLGENLDDTDQRRVDLEWFIGDHKLNFGLDYQDRQSTRTSRPVGGASYTYQTLADGADLPLRNTIFTNNTGADLDYVAVRAFVGGGDFGTEASAYYIEDTWQIADNFIINFGMRSDTFENKGTTGVTFAKFDNKLTPRLGASWDIHGDGSSKAYFTYGEYVYAIPNNTNYRMSGGISDETVNYTFTGYDATTGVPTGLTFINGTRDQSNSVNSTPLYYSTRFLQTKEAEPTRKGEWILGYETELDTEYKASARYVYRKMLDGLDDYCGDIATYGNCVLMNPGEGGTYAIDGDDDDALEEAGSYRFYTPEEIGVPKATHEYSALQFQFDRNSADTNWSLIYTWSRNYGNYEGAVLSDNGQIDAGITSVFDFPALMDGATGYLPNDRRHVLKFFGSQKLSENLTFGWNSALSSGRPKSQFGRSYPSTDPHIYGNYGFTYYHWNGNCTESNGTPGCQGAERYDHLIKVERGDAGRTPWVFQLDVNLTYNFQLFGLESSASLDVFNILDNQEILATQERYERSSGVRNQFYDAARQYQAPRSVRLGFEMRF